MSVLDVVVLDVAGRTSRTRVEDKPMSTYIALIDFTQEGVENIADSPDRLDNAKAFAESMGGDFEWYLTFGKHDAVAVGEFPDDETYAQFVLAVASQGAVGTETLKAFDEAAYRDVIAGLPDV